MNKKEEFESFITNNLDNAYRFAYVYMKNQQDAEDVVTESLIKALRSISSLKNEKYIRTWFFRIIINTAFTNMKKGKKVIPMDDSVLDYLGEINDDYSKTTFEDMIKGLPLLYKEVVVLRFFENLKIKEIADILNVNENTVKTRLYKAVNILRVDWEVI